MSRSIRPCASLVQHFRPALPFSAADGSRVGPVANPPSLDPKTVASQRLFLIVPLVQSAQNVVPVAVAAGDKIESLRQWASGRCLSADRAGVYSRSEVSGGRGRRVMRAE